MNKVQPIYTSNARVRLPFGVRYKLKVKRNFGVSFSTAPIEIINENLRYRCYPQSGLAPTNIKTGENDGEGGVESLGALTKDVNDAATKSVVRNSMKLDSGIYAKGGDGNDRYKGIKEFLAIPRILDSGVLSSTDAASTFANFNTSTNLMVLAANYDKIKGFHSVRYDTVVTLEINGNRFQTGYYMLAFVPTGGVATNSYPVFRRYDKCGITQLSHVCCDVNCDTQVQLTIPYVAGTNAMKITSGVTSVAGDPGYFFMYPYVPLGFTAGSSTASYTLWVHYTNVELFGAAIPQSGFRKGIKGKDLLAEEMKKQGPVESTMNLITDATTALSMIPLLSSVAGPMSWISEALAKSAKSFGWSKPPCIDPPHRVVREVIPYLANCDGKSAAVPLSLTVDNHVEVAPGFGGTDLDETSIDFIKSIPAYYGQFGWSTSDPSGTVLSNGYSLPTVYQYGTVDGTDSVVSFTPIAYLAMLFNQWRGGIRFHFKIVKTEFHSGRVMFAWSGVTNYTGEAIPTMSMTESQYVHKQIIDIREGSEFTIQVPFCSTTNWNNTDSLDRNISGRWYLYVLDPLKAPATVGSTVTFLLEVSGAPDLQYSVPKPFNYAPVVPTTYQSGLEQCDLSEGMVGNAQPGTYDLRHNSLSVGENVLSLRQLCKRGGFIYPISPGSASSNAIAPFAMSLLKGTAALAVGTPNYDPYSYIGCLYALNRGGMRITSVVANGSSAVALVVQAIRFLKSADTVTDVIVVPLTAIGTMFYNSVNQGIALFMQQVGGNTVQIPQYTVGHSRALMANVYTSTTPMTCTDRLTDRSVLYVRRLATTTVGDYYHRAAADDFNMGCFINIPPMSLIAAP